VKIVIAGSFRDSPVFFATRGILVRTSKFWKVPVSKKRGILSMFQDPRDSLEPAGLPVESGCREVILSRILLRW